MNRFEVAMLISKMGLRWRSCTFKRQYESNLHTKENSSFKNLVVSSSKWAILNQVFTQGIRILVSIYLMRVLDPESFGVFMKVLAIVGISEILVGLRLGGGIVQQKNVTKEQLSTVFWINTFWTLFLSIIVYFSSDFVAEFYNDNRIEDLFAFSAFVILITSIGYVPRSILTKALNFKKIFFANIISVILSSVIGIYLALTGYDYWSLFWLWASFNILVNLNFLLLSGYLPLLSFNMTSIKSMWKFSKNIVYNDIFNYLARNIDNIIVGRVLGATSLGYYSRAYNIMLLPLQNFVKVLNGVMFPSYSKIQDETERVLRIFNSVLQSISLFMTPFMLFAIFFTDELVIIIFGNPWIPLIGVLRVLLILGIIQIHTSPASSLFMAKGRSDIPLKLSFVFKPILIIIILILVNKGILWLAIGVTVVSGISSITHLIIAMSVFEGYSKSLFIELGKIWAINMSVLIPIFLLKQYDYIDSFKLTNLALSFFALLIGYYSILILFKPKSFIETKNIFSLLLKNPEK